MDEWEESPDPPQHQVSGGGGYNRDANNSNHRYNSRSFDNSNRRENYGGNNAARGDRGGNRFSNDRGGEKNRYQNQGERTNRYQDQGERNNRYQTQDDRNNRYQNGEPRENRYNQGQGERNNRYQDNNDRESRYQDRRPQQSGDRREAHDQYSQNKRPYRNDTNYNSSETMDIDPNHIKFIIGKGGSKIREIESTCNVKLQIDKNDNNVKISGATLDDVNKAIDIIKEVTSSSDSRQNRYVSTFENAAPHNQNDGDDTDLNKSAPIDWNKVNENFEKTKNLKWEHLPDLKKDFYEEDSVIENLSPEKVEEIRKEKNNIMVSRVFTDKNSDDQNIPNPILEFEQCFRKYPDLLNELKKQNFTTPSPIQSQAWPILLKGEDLIGIAQTGTGKTLAFILPAMIHIINQPIPREERTGPNVLVLAPTRELALQIQQEVQKYQFRGIKAVCIYGGGDRKEQINTVGKGVDIIIATPGRLNDLIEAKVIDVSTITYVVLDEADRMLDMGFEPQIRKTLIDIRPDRQSVMTSATWPAAIRRLAQSYMNNPIQVCVGSLNLTAVHSVSQVIEIMDEEEKFFNIKKFVGSLKPTDKVIIFCGKKDRCDDMASDFTLDGINNQCIHGNREQVDREQALKDIKNGTVQILIATDVASRGIDIDDITHVVNYDFPKNIEEYVHRVGRTGRAGRTGTSISYVTRSDWGVAAELIPILEEADEMVPIELRDMAERFDKMKQRRAAEGAAFGIGGGGGRGGRGGRGGSRGGGGGFNRRN